MPALFEIIDQYQTQLSALNDADLPAEVVMDTIEAIQGDVETKIRAVVAFALQVKADADARKAHAKRMADGAKALENRYESLLMYAQVGLMNSGLKLPLALPEFTLNLAKNPPSLDDQLNADKVPATYLKRSITFELREDQEPEDVLALLDDIGLKPEVNVSVDRRKLLDAVKANPEACKSFAKLNPQSYRLAIR